MPVHVGERPSGAVRGTAEPCGDHARLQQPSTHVAQGLPWHSPLAGLSGLAAPHLSQPGIFGLVGVVVQADAEVAGLHLVALAAQHVGTAAALPHLCHTPAARAPLGTWAAQGTPELPQPCSPSATHWLSQAPPTSQSQARQPGRSWFRAQCSGWGETRRQGLSAGAAARGPSPPALTRHWLQLRPVTRRLQKQSPLTGLHGVPSDTVPRESHWQPARESGVEGTCMAACPGPPAPLPCA